MRRSSISIVILISAFILFYIAPSYQFGMAYNENTSQNSSFQMTQEPVSIFLQKHFVVNEEKIELTVTITNYFTNEKTFLLQVNGSNFYFNQSDGNTVYEHLMNNLTLASEQSINVSLHTWFKTNSTNFVSSIQTFSVILFDNTRKNVLFSSIEWIWVYSDYNNMSKLHISESQSPLYANSKVLATYSVILNDSTPEGLVRINVNNIDDISHDYRITMTNDTQHLRFSEIFTKGFQCSLICSDRSSYYAPFSYTLPEGSIWVLLPFSIKFRMDSDPTIETDLLLELSDLKSEEILEGTQKGTYQRKNENLIEIKVYSEILKETNVGIGLIAKNKGSNNVFFPQIDVMNQYFVFNVSEDLFSESLIIFYYGDTTKDLFKVVTLQLVEISEGTILKTGSFSFPAFDLITLFLIIISIGLISKKGWSRK